MIRIVCHLVIRFHDSLSLLNKKVSSIYYITTRRSGTFTWQNVLSPLTIPDSKVHGANMGTTWVQPHIGPMNLATRDLNWSAPEKLSHNELITSWPCATNQSLHAYGQRISTCLCNILLCRRKYHKLFWWMDEADWKISLIPSPTGLHKSRGVGEIRLLYGKWHARGKDYYSGYSRKVMVDIMRA